MIQANINESMLSGYLTLSWLNMHPLGLPVVPEVNIRVQHSLARRLSITAFSCSSGTSSPSFMNSAHYTSKETMFDKVHLNPDWTEPHLMLWSLIHLISVTLIIRFTILVLHNRNFYNHVTFLFSHHVTWENVPCTGMVPSAAVHLYTGQWLSGEVDDLSPVIKVHVKQKQYDL